MHVPTALICVGALSGIIGAATGHWHARTNTASSFEMPTPPMRATARSDDAPTPPLLREIERASTHFERSRLAYERASHLSVAELDSLTRSVLATTSSQTRTIVLSVLLERWTELDAISAMHFFHAQVSHDEPAYKRLFAVWYRAWLATDQAQAIAYAHGLAEYSLRDRALLLAIEEAGDSALSDHLLAELSESARTQAYRDKAQHLAPAAAFAASLKLTDPDQRFELTSSAFARLLREDAAQALLEIEHIPADERDAVVATALAQWAGSAPEQAWQQMNRSDLPAPYRAAMLSALAELDPQHALAWLQQEASQPADSRPAFELYRAALPSLLREDLSAAAEAVADLQERAPVDLIQQVATEYAKRDARQMYAWVESLTHHSAHEQLQTLQAVSSALVAANPNAAIAYVEHADEQVRSSLLKEIASQKAAQNVRSGWEWLSRYRDDASYRENARALLGQWSYAKPTEVGEVVLGVADVELQRALAEQLAAVWRERDETAFRNWVANLPPGLREVLLRAG